MVLRVLLAVVGGVGIGYGWAHMKIGNAQEIHELKHTHSQLTHDFEQLKHRYAEIIASQELIKSKAKELVSQNEDYAKIISQLNRYYYRLQTVREAITDLQVQLQDDDITFPQKLESLTTPSSLPTQQEKRW